MFLSVYMLNIKTLYVEKSAENEAKEKAIEVKSCMSLYQMQEIVTIP